MTPIPPHQIETVKEGVGHEDIPLEYDNKPA